ncbi:hypothetical protein HED55_26385 [Ochrobactrum haematophilum]|uniref:Uncharacterized protein n=1 Tax=Brucella haematophila TaxID=419474 RepID=A0ABX1DUW7_9HYPH|nr:hypothetical protein [Brucella haematophila]
MASVRFLLANEKDHRSSCHTFPVPEILKKAFFDYCFESIGKGLRFGRTLMNAISALGVFQKLNGFSFCQQGEGSLL